MRKLRYSKLIWIRRFLVNKNDSTDRHIFFLCSHCCDLRETLQDASAHEYPLLSSCFSGRSVCCYGSHVPDMIYMYAKVGLLLVLFRFLFIFCTRGFGIYICYQRPKYSKYVTGPSGELSNILVTLLTMSGGCRIHHYMIYNQYNVTGDNVHVLVNK